MSDTPSQTAPPIVANPPQDSVWDHPVAVAGIAVASAAALAGALYLAGSFAGDTGDEPPIRVKNGSVEMYLASSHEKFKQKSTTHYKITGGPRSKDPLDVTLATTASCAALVATGQTVTIVYENDNGSTATINIGTDPDQPNQKHSAVTSSEPLTWTSADPRVLTYAGTGGFIQSVSVDKTIMCTFTKAAPLATLVIADW